MAPTESIPVLYIRAKSHYDVGLVIGKTFKSWIKDYIQASSTTQTLRDFYSTNEGRAITEKYLASAKGSHPQIISEIQGMADGSEMSFIDLFLLQLTSEIIFCYSPVTKQPPVQADEGKGCTDVLLNRKNARVIGHTEDWRADVVDRVYMVHVTITDDAENILEQFISYSYPGYLTGLCFAVNRSLVITINSLSPKTPNTSGVPLSILLRSLLACSTVDECVAALENKPQGCAYGICVHIADIYTTKMCTVEVYPNQETTEANVHEIPFDTENDQCFYCHTNYYKQINAVETDNRRGSRLRDKRASELFPVKDIEDVKRILGDTKEDVEPIFRTPSPQRWSPWVETNATAVFDISNRELHVYRSNPKLARSPCLTIPFL